MSGGVPPKWFALFVLIQHLLPHLIRLLRWQLGPFARSAYFSARGFRKKGNGQEYEHQRIPSDAVRLLRIRRHIFLPWLRTFHLITVADEELGNIEYDAVSYTWDNQATSSFIQINGHAFGITENVRDLLLGLTSRERHHLLWIDAICIDQASNVEKVSQVRKMGQIYKQARKVPVWLAPPFHSATAKAPVECLLLNDMFGKPSISWLGDLLSHRYWTRAWIVQEVALGRRVEVHYKGNIVEWDEVKAKVVAKPRYWSSRPVLAPHLPSTYVPANDFCDFFTTADHFATSQADSRFGLKSRPEIEDFFILADRMIEPPAYVDTSTLIGLRQIRRISEIKERGLRNMRQFPALVLECAGTSSSDARDKIFAFLGLVHESEHAVAADYTVSVHELFNIFARAIWTVRGGPEDLSYFDPLRLAGIGWSGHLVQGQPSWVTNWSQLPDTVHDGFSAQILHGYQAGGQKRRRIRGRLRGDLAILDKSCRIDKINAISGTIDIDFATIDGRVNIVARSWLEEICDIVQTQQLRLEELETLGVRSRRMRERDFRANPGRWRGAIFRTLTAQSQSYWGWIPERHSANGNVFERPDRCDMKALKGWYASWLNGSLGRRDFHIPDIDRELELAFEVWARLPFLYDLNTKGHLSISKRHLKILLAQAARFSLAARPHIQGRCFALTRSGHMCLVPPYTRVGDEIWVNEFASVPYVYRSMRMYQVAPEVSRRLNFHFGLNPMSTMRRTYQVVGHCFALGLMDGERTILRQDKEDWDRWKRRHKIILI